MDQWLRAHTAPERMGVQSPALSSGSQLPATPAAEGPIPDLPSWVPECICAYRHTHIQT